MNNATDRETPAKSERLNAFGQWARAHGYSATRLAEKLEAKRGQVWRWLLPVNDPAFNVPRPDALARIYLLTGGTIEPNHFHDLEAWRAALGRKVAA